MPAGRTQPLFGQAAAQEAQYSEQWFRQPPIFSDPEAVADLKEQAATIQATLNSLKGRSDSLSLQMKTAYSARLQDIHHRVTAYKPLDDQIVAMTNAARRSNAQCLYLQQVMEDTAQELEAAVANSNEVEKKLEDLMHQQRCPTPQQQQQQPQSPPHDHFSLGELSNALASQDFVAQTSDADRAGAENLLGLLANFLAATRPQPATVITVAPASTDAYQQPVPEEGGTRTPFSDVGGNFDYAGDMGHHMPFDPTLEEQQIVSTPTRLSQPGSPRARTGTRPEPASPARVFDEEELLDASDSQPAEKLAKKYAPSEFFLSLQTVGQG
jgi:hypothetical protein